MDIAEYDAQHLNMRHSSYMILAWVPLSPKICQCHAEGGVSSVSSTFYPFPLPLAL
jgi:hypothetical protein